MGGLKLCSLRDQLLRGAHFATARFGIRVAEEEIAREVDRLAQFAAEQRMYRDAQLLPHDVEAGEFDRGVQLRAVVVEAGGRVADLEAQRFQRKDVVAAQVGFEAGERAGCVLAAAAHFAEADEAVGRLDLDDGPHEAAPMRAVAVQERRFERHRHGRRANGGDCRGSHVSPAGPPQGTEAPPRGAASEASVGVVSIPAGPPQGTEAPPRGAASEASVGVVSIPAGPPQGTEAPPRGAASEARVAVVSIPAGPPQATGAPPRGAASEASVAVVSY